MSKLIPLVVLDSVIKILESRIPTANYDPLELETITLAQEVLEQLGPLTKTHIPENIAMRVTMEVIVWLDGQELPQTLTVSGSFDRDAWGSVKPAVKSFGFSDMGVKLVSEMVEQLKNYKIL